MQQHHAAGLEVVHEVLVGDGLGVHAPVGPAGMVRPSRGRRLGVDDVGVDVLGGRVGELLEQAVAPSRLARGGRDDLGRGLVGRGWDGRELDGIIVAGDQQV